MSLGLGVSISRTTKGGGGGPDAPAFTFTVDTTKSGSAADTFIVPLKNNGSIDLVIDWGDSTSDVIILWNDPKLTHIYALPGTYEIKITATTGTLRGWAFNWGGDKAKMLDIAEWGPFNFTNSSTFTQCSSMVCTATDLPNITGNSLQYAFYQCSLWNPATAGSWDVSSVVSLNSIFIFCTPFNQDLDGWDVSNVTDFGGMFYGTLFNYPLPNWDTGKGNSFNQMFFGTPFNQHIDMWDMSSATSLFSMFYNCTAFNQDLNSWDTSKVTNMWSTFTGCTVFNGDISSWDTSAVTNFSGMFQSCPVFNGDISNWIVSAATNFSYMFKYATAFNQDLSAWNTVDALTMDDMFYLATAFNKDIGGWNTAKVTNMESMLRNLPSFDQDLSGWNIANVADLSNFMQGTTLTLPNYDALLSGWDAQAVVGGLSAHFGGSTYTNCAAVAAARENLVSTSGWTITDGGGIPTGCPFTFTIDTENAGSATKTFVLPIVDDGTINMEVDWGDGSDDTITLWNQAEVTHVYAATGIYTIEILGSSFRGWRFNGGGDKDKILNISQWGVFDFTFKDTFKRCTNLTSTATDIPSINLTDFAFCFESCTSWSPPNMSLWDMSSVTRLNWMFFGCTSFNQPIGAWETSNVTELSYMLYNCTSFDQNLSNWEVGAVINYSGFFTNGTLSTVNYDALLIGWEAQSVSSGETPNFGNSKYSLGGVAEAARDALIAAPNLWTITDGGGI